MENLQQNPRAVVEGNLDSKSELRVILPTYCEAGNIEEIIREIEKLNLNLSILVIDDSRMEQLTLVRKMQKEYGNIILLTRPRKIGFGTAIKDGFKLFLSLKNPPKYIITMDADHSHNPAEIPRLLAPVKYGGYSLCIESRYCQGGTVKNWDLLRKVISKTANIIAKLAIRAQITDYTSGLRCYSTTFVKNIENELHSKAYEIQVETIKQAHKRGFRIAEVPITFINRKKGKSKLSLHEICDFILYICKCIINGR